MSPDPSRPQMLPPLVSLVFPPGRAALVARRPFRLASGGSCPASSSTGEGYIANQSVACTTPSTLRRCVALWPPPLTSFAAATVTGIGLDQSLRGGSSEEEGGTPTMTRWCHSWIRSPEARKQHAATGSGVLSSAWRRPLRGGASGRVLRGEERQR